MYQSTGYVDEAEPSWLNNKLFGSQKDSKPIPFDRKYINHRENYNPKNGYTWHYLSIHKGRKLIKSQRSRACEPRDNSGGRR